MKTIYALLCALTLTGCGAKVVTGDTSTSGGSAPTRPGALPSADGGEAEINGTCELILPTQADPRTCEDVTLFIRNPNDGEERRAEMAGSKFKFKGLNKGSYRFEAASSKYDLTTNVKNEVTPGQTLKIRILAKPRS